MAPNGQTNLAVKDLVTSLQFLKKVVPAFGGSTSKITLAGQSSGANMIRALLAVPSASSLFRSAILQSDPMVSTHDHIARILYLIPFFFFTELWLPQYYYPEHPIGQLHRSNWL